MTALPLDPRSVPQRVPPLVVSLVISMLQYSTDFFLTPQIAEGTAIIFLRMMALLILFQGLNAPLKYTVHKTAFLKLCIQVKTMNCIREKSQEISNSIPEIIVCLLEPIS